MSLISFCIPTYNRCELLDRALQSILAGFEKQDIEIIITDNASTDKTRDLVREYQTKYPFIKYFRNELNIGLDANAQLCISKAKSEYIFTFADDDVFLAETAESLVQSLKIFSPSFMYLRYRDFGEHEQPTDIYTRFTDINKPSITYNDGLKMLLDFYPVHFSAMIFKKTELDKYLSRLRYYLQSGYERGFTATYLADYILLSSSPPFIYFGDCCVASRVVKDKSYRLVYAYGIDTLRQCERLKSECLLNDKQIHKLVNKHFMWHTAKIIALVKSKGQLGSKESHLLRKYYAKFPMAYFMIYPLLIMPDILIKPILNIVMRYRRLMQKVTGITEFEYE